ncbi:MAG: tRNA dimethylallyltransferase, partial [Aquificaceae bacterium]|nr:tRNA dimethylallyltransferase [Aquificaceae bacterium]
QAIGYKEMLPCVKGERHTQECLTEMVRKTKEYAKRQIRWFRKQGWVQINVESLGIEGAVNLIISKLHSSYFYSIQL